MNNIILTCNRVFNNRYCSNIDEDFLREFNGFKAKICRGSLVFCLDFDYHIKLTRHEVVESDPEMESEELLKIWRLLYE